ncbi:MAG: threonine/serine exporter family protein [Gordonia sp. (in: high G+C Gram-positive bacteria)]|uniref:threonine/serine exporter family protein n=1 Tax=Gordonia sp. (in: high G+C Gram-positive bacteria) TaxID=84139 RepID=UPI0039E56E7D
MSPSSTGFDAARRDVDALARLIAALIGSGFSTGEAFVIGDRCAYGLGLNDGALLDLGTAVSVQYVTDDGQTVARTVPLDSLGAIDCQKMKELHLLSGRVGDGSLDADGLDSGLETIAARSGPRVWTITGGMAVLAFAIALQVGIGWIPALVTAVVQIPVTLFGVAAGRWGIRRFFTSAAQAVLAAGLVALAYLVHLIHGMDAAAAVGVPWLLTIPLPVLIALTVDLVYERPMSALARGVVVLLGGGGVALGAAAVLTVLASIDRPGEHVVELPTLPLVLGLVFSMIGAVANALGNGGSRDLLLPAAGIGLLTAGVNQSLIHLAHFPGVWAAIVASAVLGYASTFWERRSPYPIGVLALMGITGAIIPGLTVYEGIAKTVLGESGTEDFLMALLTGVGIGVGVAFGFMLATIRDRVAERI